MARQVICPVCGDTFPNDGELTCENCQYCADPTSCTVKRPCSPCRFWMERAS